MSIRVIIQRSIVYIITAIMIMSFFSLVLLLSGQAADITSLAISTLAALAIAVIYQPLMRSIQNIADRIFFRARYDYQKTLREMSQKIASVIKLEELSKLIVTSFYATMRVSEISFLLLDKEKEHFRSVVLSLPGYKKIEIDVGSPIISRLSATRDILVRNKIKDKPDLREVRDEMDRLGISLWMPIITKDAFIGIIALGNKLSGENFSAEDIGLISTLANQTAVALDNARLYDEVVSMKDYSEEILRSMVNGVITVDLRRRIITFNQMAGMITGRPVPEVLGKTCEEVWGKQGVIPGIIDSTLDKGKIYMHYESGVASPERGLVPVSFSTTLLKDHRGKKTGVLLAMQDLTEVRELEDKIRRADKLAALATMAAGMAHEIKNPLSSMKVLSQLLPHKFDDPEYRKKLQEIFPREIGRIDRIVESLLSFARATALNFEKTSINAVIEENLKYYEGQAKASDVRIVKSYAELPEAEVDRYQITQVFSNLILNAIQAMPQGGELNLSTLPGKSVEGMLREIKIRISDTGHGMPEETIKKLFDPFFTTKYGGTGLGLTITHNIIDGHKGFIDVESKPGKGTTFTVTLPVSQGLV